MTAPDERSPVSPVGPRAELHDKLTRIAARGFPILLAAAGAGLAILVTRWGAGLSDDTYPYVRPALDVLESRPPEWNPSWAPFLPMVLVGLAQVGIGPLAAIRVLNGLLFGVNLYLAGCLSARIAGYPGAVVLGLAAVGMAPAILEAHAWALSEPLFVTLSAGAILTLGDYLDRGRRSDAMLAALLAGLTAVTRYAGLALIAAGGFVLAVTRGIHSSRRIKESIVFITIALLPIGAYAVRNLLEIGRPVGRSDFHLEFVLDFPWVRTARNILVWFLPGRVVVDREAILIAIVGAIALGICVLVALDRPIGMRGVARSLAHSAHLRLLLAYAVTGLGILVVGRGLLRGGDTVYERYLVPSQFAILAAIMGVIGFAWRRSSAKVRIALALGLIGFLALQGYRTAERAVAIHRDGLGYASSRWHVSETIAYLRARPDRALVSTAPFGIFFWTGRLPRRISNAQGIIRMKARMCEEGEWLVIIDSLPPEYYNVQTQDLIGDLRLVERFSEGSIYECGLRDEPTSRGGAADPAGRRRGKRVPVLSGKVGRRFRSPVVFCGASRAFFPQLWPRKWPGGGGNSNACGANCAMTLVPDPHR